MKIRRKFTCDYCQKDFVNAKFFKSSHKNTVNHVLARGRYYEQLITKQKILAMKRMKRIQRLQIQTKDENQKRLESEISTIESTCPHVEIFG